MSEPQTETPTPEETPVEEPSAPETPVPTPDVETPDETPSETPQEAPEAPEDDEPEETPAEPEQAPETPPSSPAQMEAMDKAYRSIERSATNYVTRVAEWGQEFEQPIVPCPICAGFLPGFRYSAMVVPFSEDEKKFARTVAGIPDEPDYKQAQDAHVCSDCDGQGKVLTGSRRNDQRTRICFTCKGLGWEGRGAADTADQRSGANVVAIAAPEQPQDDVPDLDPWLRPPDHPGYGKMPNLCKTEADLPPGWHFVNGVASVA